MVSVFWLDGTRNVRVVWAQEKIRREWNRLKLLHCPLGRSVCVRAAERVVSEAGSLALAVSPGHLSLSSSSLFFFLLLLLFPSHLLLPIISRCFIFLMEFCWWCFFFFSLHFSPSPVLGRSRPAKVLRRKYFPRVAEAMSSLSLI